MKTTNFFLTIAFFLSLSFYSGLLIAQDADHTGTENCLCERLKEGQAEFNFENGVITIDGHSMIVEVDGISRSFTFDFNLAEVICNVADGQMFAEAVENNGSIETDETELEFLSFQDIMIGLSTDYGSPRLGLRFQSQEQAGDNLSEFSISLSIDIETCTFTLQLWMDGELYEFAETGSDLEEIASSFTPSSFEDMDQGTWALATGILYSLMQYGDTESDAFQAVKSSFFSALMHYVDSAQSDGATGQFAIALDDLAAAIDSDDLGAVSLALTMLVVYV
ncbi:MAG: hypothetical protein AAF502_05425 [Bacteroidota bacterium]